MTDVKTPGSGMSRVLALDVGGTWTRLACADVGPDGVVTLGPIRRLATLGGGRAAYLAQLSGALREARYAADPPVVVGVSVTGPVDPRTGRLHEPPNTDRSLGGLDVRELCSAATGLAVVVDRDTNCALLAEVTLGAARGRRHAVFATVSTGVGAGVLVDGQILRGRDGVAGELGHLGVDPSGPECGCGRRGCLESIASGPALARAAGRVSGLAVALAAAEGDAEAAAVLARAGAAVVSACVDWVNTFNPEVIVLGGSVAAGQPAWVEQARRAVREQALVPARSNCPVVLSTLADEVSLLGAALLGAGALGAGALGAGVPPRPPDHIHLHPPADGTS